MSANIIKTERLVLRPWKESDREAFAKMNADPRVMEFFLSVLTREKSNRMIERISEFIDKHGWGFWAASLIDTDQFIGLIGIQEVSFNAPFIPDVEIGWRLGFEHWGKGYAVEGALAALDYGFQKLNLEEIVSFTAVQNVRSQRVMEKIGMTHDPKDDFDHPKLPEGHWLRRHVLFRKSK